MNYFKKGGFTLWLAAVALLTTIHSGQAGNDESIDFHEKEYGTSTKAGTSVKTGFVIIENEYIMPPYTVTRKGSAVTINGAVVKGPIPPVPKPRPVPKSDPPIPESINRNSGYKEIRPYVDKKYDYLTHKYTDREKAYSKYIETLKELPCVKSVEPFELLENSIKIRFFSGEKMIEDFSPQPESRKTPEDVLDILNRLRDNWEKDLQDGQCVIFGDGVSYIRISAEAEAIANRIDVLKSKQTGPPEKAAAVNWLREVGFGFDPIKRFIADRQIVPDGAIAKALGINWDLGNFWQLELPLEHAAITRELGRDHFLGTMSVVATPALTENTYVLEFEHELRRRSMFFVLKDDDLSLIEVRRAHNRHTPWNKSELVSEYPGGAPIVVKDKFMKLAFPVLTDKDILHKYGDRDYVILQQSEQQRADAPLGYKYSLIKAKDEETARTKAAQGHIDYETLWQQDDNWWKYCEMAVPGENTGERINMQQPPWGRN